MAMRTIGLIGGMSFESSAIYYKMINEAVRDRLGGLHSAEIMLHSVDFQTIVDMQKAGRWTDAALRLSDVARRLETAGADCVLICTNTMHLLANEIQAAIGVPLINIIDETAKCLKAAGVKRPLMLATRYTMEHGFYGDRLKNHGIEMMVPNDSDRTAVHDIIFNELCAGKVLDASREKLIGIIQRAKSEGADTVILGCTEICLILNSNGLPLPGFDSTEIHCKAAIEFALDGVIDSKMQAA